MILLLILVSFFHNSGAAMELACAFVHGLGRNGTFRVRHGLPRYWGWTGAMVQPYCNHQSYMDANTIVHPWSSPRLHDVACATLKKHQNNATRVVVFTHSMGNLIFAAAMQSGKCFLRRHTDAWVVMGAPWHGLTRENMARIAWLCRHTGDRTCDAHTGLPGPSMQSLSADTPGLLSLATVATRQAAVYLCGNLAFGVFSRFSIPLVLFGAIVLQQPVWGSDGMVLTSACLAPATRHVRTYVVSLNHADTAGRTRAFELHSWYADVLTHIWASVEDSRRLFPQE